MNFCDVVMFVIFGLQFYLGLILLGVSVFLLSGTTAQILRNNVDKLTRTRQGHRSAVTKLINSVRAILTDSQEKDRIKLISLQASLSDKGHLLDNLNQQILNLIEDKDEIRTDIGRKSEVNLTLIFTQNPDGFIKKRTIMRHEVMTGSKIKHREILIQIGNFQV